MTSITKLFHIIINFVRISGLTVVINVLLVTGSAFAQDTLTGAFQGTTVIKQFSVYNRRLSYRADIFNFINRANFGIPIRLLEAPGFGKATGTVTPGRRIQVSLKYDF